MTKSLRDIAIQAIGQAIVALLVRAGIIPEAMRLEAMAAAVAAVPALYRGLRALDNPLGRWLQKVDPSGTALDNTPPPTP